MALDEDERDQAWMAGLRFAYEQLFRTAARELGICVSEDGKRLEGSYAVERNATVRALRQMCADLGLNSDWDDEVSLEDVVAKRIAPYVTKRRKR